MVVRGTTLLNISDDAFHLPGMQFFLGSPPMMLELLTSVAPLEFKSCWSRKTIITHEFGAVYYLGIDDLRIAKLHASRSVDLEDLKTLV